MNAIPPPADRDAVFMDRLKTVLAIVVVIVTIIIWIYLFQNKKQRDAAIAAAPRYTIGQITRTAYVVGPSAHTETFFEYRVHDSVYSGSSSGKAADGQSRFLVKFSAQQPAIRQFYDQVPVPNSIQAAPPGGWLEPPFPVPDYVRE